MKIRNKRLRRIMIPAVLSAVVLTEALAPVCVLAGPATASVDETLYLNLDYYGGISKANVVKGISFNSLKSYTDYGNYLSVTNMTTDEKPVEGSGSVTFSAPENGGKFFFEGELDPKKVTSPWTFDVTYKVNGVVTNAEDVAGASGTIEMDIDCYPNEKASEYMKNNFMLICAVPIDNNKVYSVDAPDSQTINLGQYSGVAFEALPGKEAHFVVRMGTDSFETVGAIIMMSPGTVGDLEDLKDLKELKDKFRDNTNAMMDDVDALMDNVTDVSEQLSLTNEMLSQLKQGKSKIDASKDVIFNGNDVAIQDLRDLSTSMTPLSDSLKTVQWMVYDVNKNLNSLDQDLLDTTSKMKTLSTRLKTLGSSMSGVDNLTAQEIISEISEAGLTDALKKVQSGAAGASSAADEFSTIVGKGVDNLTAQEIISEISEAGLTDALKKVQSGAAGASSAADEFSTIVGKGVASASDASSKLVTDAALSNTMYEEEYLPQAVISAVQQSLGSNTDLSDATKKAAAEQSVAQLLDIYTALRNAGDTADSEGSGLITEDNDGSAVSTASLLAAAAALKAAQSGTAGALDAYSGNSSFLSLALQLSSEPSYASATAKQQASRFVGRLQSVQNLQKSAEDISKNAADSSTQAGKKLTELQSALEELGSGLADAAGIESAALISGIDSVLSDIEDIADDAGAVSFQTARFLNSASKLSGDLDSLIGTMNNYYDDLQKAVSNTDDVLGQIQKTTDDLAGTLQTVNDTLRSASENLSAAGDAALAAGDLAVDNTEKIVDNTKNLKDSGADLRKSINDELDEKEAENNFLNMDPDAVKESFTSEKNQEPTALSIVCRTEEISVDDDEEESLDAETEEESSGVLQRIANVFKKIWHAVKKLLGMEKD